MCIHTHIHLHTFASDSERGEQTHTCAAETQADSARILRNVPGTVSGLLGVVWGRHREAQGVSFTDQLPSGTYRVFWLLLYPGYILLFQFF